jgi:membrane-bound ClpP family serine protease
MLEWVVVGSMILIGLVLIVIEIIFIPGTTVVGILGLIFLIVGISLSFSYYGQQVGWATLGGTTVVSGFLLYYAFKANVWGAFSLKSTNQGKVNEGGLDGLAVGQEGRTLSSLRPSGKAEVGEKMYEVKTLGEFVETGTRIRIIQIMSNQIIVEPIH